MKRSLLPISQFSGEHAWDNFYNKLRRISPKRYERTAEIAKVIEFFGGIIEWCHQDDVVEGVPHNHLVLDGSEPRQNGESKDDLLGMFLPHCLIIEIPIHRHGGWGSVENTLRHEAVHLLQEVTDMRKPWERDSHNLMSSHADWGKWLADHCREWGAKEDCPPDFEIEAYSLETWIKTFEDMAKNIMSKPEKWMNKVIPLPEYYEDAN